jgi:beta-mannosidase
MRKTDLTGEWTLRKAGSRKSFTAQVPGCVPSDLLAAGEWQNPLVAENLRADAEFLKAGWIYEKIFTWEGTDAFDRTVLHFDGVLPPASVALNGNVLGDIRSVQEPAEFDVKGLLKSGKNTITVSFPPHALPPPAGKFQREESLYSERIHPASPAVGISRDVSLLSFSEVRVKDVDIRQTFAGTAGVRLGVFVECERYHPETHLEILVRVCYRGNILHEARDILGTGPAELHLTVKNPQLWWPVGLGGQPLYEVTVDVLSKRVACDHVSRRIGLHEMSLAVENAGGVPILRTTYNGHPFFIKGATWLPADIFAPRLTRVEYARQVKAAASANMNCFRVWGGAALECEAFYDLCDEYGICVIQDLPLTDSLHTEKPDVETLGAFGRCVESEARSLRHHACLLMWSGGDGRAIHPKYAEAAKAILAKEDVGRAFFAAKPHEPFSLGGEVSAKIPPSYPLPRVVAVYLPEEEQRNSTHPVSEYHTFPKDGLRAMFDGFVDEFLLPSSFENTIWLSEIQQGLALKRQIEDQRTSGRPESGFLFWHFNDCWPACSPATVDCAGHWKAAHYMARRFFSPYSVCARYNAKAGAVGVFVGCDPAAPFKGEVQWLATLMDGTVVAEGNKKVSPPPGTCENAMTVGVAELLKKHGPRQLLFWCHLMDGFGNQAAWNILPFAPWKALETRPPKMRVEIHSWNDSSFTVTLTSYCPALWVWVSLLGEEAWYDDNFFCLEPAKPYRIRVTPAKHMKLDQFRQRLRIGSLRDTYRTRSFV